MHREGFWFSLLLSAASAVRYSWFWLVRLEIKEANVAEEQWQRHETLGWRAVIGAMYPTFGGLIPANGEMDDAVPKGVVFHRAHFNGPHGWSVDAVKAVLPQIPEVAKEAAFPGVDMVIQSGLPIGIIEGIGTDKKIISAIEKTTGVKGTTTITCVVEALKKLQVTKVIIVTGYFGEQVNGIFKKFMQDSGFEVVYHTERGGGRYSDVPPHAYYRIVKDAYHKFPQAQGILISPGRAFSSMEIIEPLETDLRIPVVTQNSATLWNVLNIVEVREPVERWGRLLKMF